MLAYVVRRCLLTVPVLVGVATLVFLLIHLVPGDPAEAMLGESAAPTDLAALRTRLGLDQPLAVQYKRFATGLLHGQMGTSFRYNTPVTSEILSRLGRTTELALTAMAVAILIALPLGVLGAVYRGRAPDQIAMLVSLAGVAMPNFWLGPVLAIVFAIQLGWLPVSGTGTWQHLVLPSITLSVFQLALIMRLVRAEMLEVLRTDYIKFARARGLSDRAVYFGHALKNTLVPVITITGLQLGQLIAFAIITETVFQWPGMGLLFIQAVQFADIPVMAAYLCLIALIFVLINLSVDLLYFAVDPRLRIERVAAAH